MPAGVAQEIQGAVHTGFMKISQFDNKISDGEFKSAYRVVSWTMGVVKAGTGVRFQTFTLTLQRGAASGDLMKAALTRETIKEIELIIRPSNANTDRMLEIKLTDAHLSFDGLSAFAGSALEYDTFQVSANEAKFICGDVNASGEATKAPIECTINNVNRQHT